MGNVLVLGGLGWLALSLGGAVPLQTAPPAGLEATVLRSEERLAGKDARVLLARGEASAQSDRSATSARGERPVQPARKEGKKRTRTQPEHIVICAVDLKRKRAACEPVVLPIASLTRTGLSVGSLGGFPGEPGHDRGAYDLWFTVHRLRDGEWVELKVKLEDNEGKAEGQCKIRLARHETAILFLPSAERPTCAIVFGCAKEVD